MPQKYKLTFLQENTSIEASEGSTLMEALKEAGIFLDAPCGGRGTCGKCLVKISENGSDWAEVKACQTKINKELLVDTENSPKNHRIRLFILLFPKFRTKTIITWLPLISVLPPLQPIFWTEEQEKKSVLPAVSIPRPPMEPT